jgi:hypothetical protein
VERVARSRGASTDSARVLAVAVDCCALRLDYLARA